MDQNDPKIGEWQESERVVPVLEFEPEFDDFGRVSGVKHKIVDKTLKERFVYASLTDHGLCQEDEHYFEIRNGGKREHGRVIVQCRKCSLGRNFVPGFHRIENGRIFTIPR